MDTNVLLDQAQRERMELHLETHRQLSAYQLPDDLRASFARRTIQIARNNKRKHRAGLR